MENVNMLRKNFSSFVFIVCGLLFFSGAALADFDLEYTAVHCRSRAFENGGSADFVPIVPVRK